MKKLDKTLIIGIGNNTRQDDGLGWCFLDALISAGFNEENLLYKYQLMVEDAELISEFETIVFVDACRTYLSKGFSIEELYPAENVSFSTHAVPPNQILNLCKTIYQKNPKAYVVKIQGYEWDYKIELSKKATINLKNAFLDFNQLIPKLKII